MSAKSRTNALASGPWLQVVRVSWFLVVGLGIMLNLLGIPQFAAQINTVCTSGPCDYLLLTPAEVQSLQQFGLSLPLYTLYSTAVFVLPAFVFLLVGAGIFCRKSDDRMAVLASFMLITQGFSNSIGPFEFTSGLLQDLTAFYVALAGISLMLFVMLFPDGRFVPRWVRWLIPLFILREILSDIYISNPIFDFPLFFEIPLGLFIQAYRYRRVSNSFQRQQTKWVVFGIAVTAVGTFADYWFFNYISPGGTRPGPLINMLISASRMLILLFLPLSIAFAILRSHLWDIDVIIRRTLVYGILTALLALLYLGSVTLLQQLLSAVTGQRSDIAIIISTLAIAALSIPLRNRIQAGIDHRFYRRKYDTAKVLATFAGTVRDEVDLNRLTDELQLVVEETMQPEQVSLWLKPAEKTRRRPV